MGLNGVSMSELLIVLLIVALLFGTRRLRTIGTDLGTAIRGFRRSMSGVDDEKPDPESKRGPDAGRTEERRPTRQESDI
jgi:sec-independent protein translocase protein TatA